MKKTLLAALLSSVLSFSAMANTVFETVDLFQAKRGGGLITAINDELIGIGIVNRISDSNNNVIWENGDDNSELTLYFYNYFAKSLVPGSTPGIDIIHYSGGVLEMYMSTNRDFSAAGTQAHGITSVTNGSLWLSLRGTPDIYSLQSISFRTNGVAFQTTTNFTTSGLLEITGGSAADQFNTNKFSLADKDFTSSGKLNSTSAWSIRGTGELQGYTQQIPEPTTLTLLGLGLLGLGYTTRKE